MTIFSLWMMLSNDMTKKLYNKVYKRLLKNQFSDIMKSRKSRRMDDEHEKVV